MRDRTATVPVQATVAAIAGGMDVPGHRVSTGAADHTARSAPKRPAGPEGSRHNSVPVTQCLV